MKNCIETVKSVSYLKSVSESEGQIEAEANRLVHIIKSICDVADFEIVGRIHFKHKKSGKEFR